MCNLYLDKAKMLLEKTENTCVLCGDQVIITDKRRGVRPLLDLVESNTQVAGFAAADKVVGKAAAFLYCLLKIDCLFAKVISQPALAILDKYQIPVEYETLVPSIRNRSNTGPCPMEYAVWDTETPETALLQIQTKLKELAN